MNTYRVQALGVWGCPSWPLGSEWYPGGMDTVQSKVRGCGTCRPRGTCRASWLMGRGYSHCQGGMEGWGRLHWEIDIWTGYRGWTAFLQGKKGWTATITPWVSLAKPWLFTRPCVKRFTDIISLLLPIKPWSVNWYHPHLRKWRLREGLPLSSLISACSFNHCSTGPGTLKNRAWTQSQKTGPAPLQWGVGSRRAQAWKVGWASVWWVLHVWFYLSDKVRVQPCDLIWSDLCSTQITDGRTQQGLKISMPTGDQPPKTKGSGLMGEGMPPPPLRVAGFTPPALPSSFRPFAAFPCGF